MAVQMVAVRLFKQFSLNKEQSFSHVSKCLSTFPFFLEAFSTWWGLWAILVIPGADSVCLDFSCPRD